MILKWRNPFEPNARQQPPIADADTEEIFKHNADYGTGQKGARAAKRKYYLKENENLKLTGIFND
jgi:hypothetical protein